MNYDAWLFFGDNDLDALLQYGCRRVEFYNCGKKIISNTPRIFIIFDKCNMIIESNSCSDISTSVIKSSLDDQNILTLYYL